MNTDKQFGGTPQGYHGQPEPDVYPHAEGQEGPGVSPNVPPPYEPYTQQPSPQASQIQVVQAPVVVAAPVGPVPSNTVCPSCKAQIVTRIAYKSSTKTHLIALLLCAVGCWLCTFIPYYTNSCKNVEHYCPNCNAYIGTYSN